MMNIDDAISHAREVAQEKYIEGFLCHANPNDEELDYCIECAREHEQLAEWLEELKEYKQLEEQGLLIKLPCKVGSTVYLIYGKYTKCSKYGEEFEEYNCQGCEEECDSRKEYLVHTNHSVSLEWIVRNTINFGKTVFLTQTEAEEALKRMSK